MPADYAAIRAIRTSIKSLPHQGGDLPAESPPRRTAAMVRYGATAPDPGYHTGLPL